MSDLRDLLARALDEAAGAADERGLDDARIRYLGKKGEITQQLKRLGSLPAAERPAAGQAINQAKQELQEALNRRKAELRQEQLALRLARERIDITLPGRGQRSGGLHPVTLTLQAVAMDGVADSERMVYKWRPA